MDCSISNQKVKLQEFPRDVLISICKYLSAVDIAALACANVALNTSIKQDEFGNYLKNRVKNKFIDSDISPIKAALRSEGFQRPLKSYMQIKLGSWPLYLLPCVKGMKRNIGQYGMYLFAFTAATSLLIKVSSSEHCVKSLSESLRDREPEVDDSRYLLRFALFTGGFAAPLLVWQGASWLLDKTESYLEKQVREDYDEFAKPLLDSASACSKTSITAFIQYLPHLSGTAASLGSVLLLHSPLLASITGLAVHEVSRLIYRHLNNEFSDQISLFKPMISEIVQMQFDRNEVAKGYQCYLTGKVATEWEESTDGFLDASRSNPDKYGLIDTVEGFRYKLAIVSIKLRTYRHFYQNSLSVSPVFARACQELMDPLQKEHENILKKVDEQFKDELRRYRSRLNLSTVKDQIREQIDSCLSGDKFVQFTPYLSLIEKFS